MTKGAIEGVSIEGADQFRMEAWNAQLPLLRQLLLRPTWTGYGAGGDIQEASQLCAVNNLWRPSRRLGHFLNALSQLGCHRLPDRGQL